MHLPVGLVSLLPFCLFLFSWPYTADTFSCSYSRTKQRPSLNPYPCTTLRNRDERPRLLPSPPFRTSCLYVQSHAFASPVLSTDSLAEMHAEVPGNRVIGSGLVNWLLRRLIIARSRAVKGLTVQVRAKSTRFLFTGKIDRLAVQFDELFWRSIQITGGARLEVFNIDLRYYGLLVRRPLLSKPYEIAADFTLVQSDIINSFLIRNTVQNMVNTILSRIAPNSREIVSLTVQRVYMKNRRMFVDGKADLITSGTGVPFQVSSSLAVRSNGHVIALPNPLLVLNPDSILQTQVPLATGPVEVDLGEGFRIHSLVVDNKCIRVRAQTRISPVDPFTVAPRANTSPSLLPRAQYTFDMGGLLSRILRNRMARWFPTK